MRLGRIPYIERPRKVTALCPESQRTGGSASGRLSRPALPTYVPGVLPSRLAALLAAIPDFAIAGLALATWISPTRVGEEKVAWFLGLMLLEFIVVHSSAFLGMVALSDAPRPKRVVRALLLSAFYTMFAAAFAVGMKHWWPLWAFWMLTANRLLGILLGQAPTGHERDFAMANWATGAVCYLLGAFVTVLLPLPQLGVRPGMLGAIADDAGGLWLDEPHRVLAFAVLYFTLTGLLSLFSHRWTPPAAARATA